MCANYGSAEPTQATKQSKKAKTAKVGTKKPATAKEAGIIGPRGSYIQFSAWVKLHWSQLFQRPAVKAMKTKEQSAFLGQLWAMLPPAVKQPWEGLAAFDKERCKAENDLLTAHGNNWRMFAGPIQQHFKSLCSLYQGKTFDHFAGVLNYPLLQEAIQAREKEALSMYQTKAAEIAADQRRQKKKSQQPDPDDLQAHETWSAKVFDGMGFGAQPPPASRLDSSPFGGMGFGDQSPASGLGGSPFGATGFGIPTSLDASPGQHQGEFANLFGGSSIQTPKSAAFAMPHPSGSTLAKQDCYAESFKGSGTDLFGRKIN